MKRPLVFNGDTVLVILTKGHVAEIDAQDALLVANMSWTAKETATSAYAYRRENGRKVYLHRVIAEAPGDMIVDHKDGNPLNNRRSNLRVCTRRQNSQNRKTPSNNTSGYKGVSWLKPRGKWSARIRVDGKRMFLGTFDSAEEAYSAYCKAAKIHHKDFAKLD